MILAFMGGRNLIALWIKKLLVGHLLSIQSTALLGAIIEL